MLPNLQQTQVGAIVKRCGVSILISSLCTSIGFACAALVPVPALRFMCLQASILLLVNLAVVLLVFPAFLSIDIRRRKAKRADILCCFPSPSPVKNNSECTGAMRTADTTCCLPQPSNEAYLPPEHKSSIPFSEITPEKISNKTNVISENWPNVNTDPMTPSVDSLGSTRSLVADGLGIRDCVLSVCSKMWHGYIACVTSEKCRAAGVVFLLISIVASTWGVSQLKDGLSLTALVPRGSSEAAFLEAQQKHFSIYHMFAVTKGHFEYPRYQKLLHEYHATFTRVPYILKDDNGGLTDSWLATFRDWLLGLQKTFDRDWQNGCITEEKWYANASDDAVMAYKLLVQTGHVEHPVDKSLVSQVI